MRIKRIDPISAAKVGGVLYAGLGLVIGACVSLVMMAIGGAAAFTDEGSHAAPFVGMLFGAGSIVILPIFFEGSRAGGKGGADWPGPFR